MAAKIFLFLDIDGVLNRARDWDKSLFPLNVECIRRFGKTVQKLREENEVHVVLSSSWRDGFSPREGHSAQIATLVERLKPFGIEIEGRTPFFPDGDRAAEINAYIAEKNLGDAICIALDDTEELFRSPLAKNLSLRLINPGRGFCRADFAALTKTSCVFGGQLGEIFKKIVAFFGGNKNIF